MSFTTSRTRQKIYHLDLPEAKGRLCCSSLGWFITLPNKQNEDCQIKLPDFKMFKGRAGKLHSAKGIRFFDDIKKFVLSSSPLQASSYTWLGEKPSYNFADERMNSGQVYVPRKQ